MSNSTQNDMKEEQKRKKMLYGMCMAMSFDQFDTFMNGLESEKAKELADARTNDRVHEASKTIRSECLPSDGTLYTQGQLDKAVDDAKKEVIDTVISFIDELTTPDHPQVHSIRGLRLSSSELRKFVDRLATLKEETI